LDARRHAATAPLIQCLRVVHKVIDHHRGLDILVNNVGRARGLLPP
jgi:hypothetical protein